MCRCPGIYGENGGNEKLSWSDYYTEDLVLVTGDICKKGVRFTRDGGYCLTTDNYDVTGDNEFWHLKICAQGHRLLR